MKKSIPNFNMSRSLRVLLICFTLIGGMAFTARAQQVIGLQKAIELALDRNLTIKQSQFNEAIDDENLKQAKYNQLPNLTASPQGSFNHGRSVDPSTNQFINQSIFGLNGTISSQVLLFQGGALKNQILENKLLLDVDKSNTAKVKNDLILNVITTYLAVLTDQDLLEAAKQQVEISKLNLDKVQKNFDVGNNTLADLSQAKATVSTNDLNQTTAQNNLDISILSLKQYMEMDPTTQITVEKPDISKLTVKVDYDAQQVFNSALNVNPDVHLATVQKEAAAQNIKIAQSNYYPSLGLFGALGSDFSSASKLPSAHYTGGVDTIGFVESSKAPVVVPAYGYTYNKYPFTNQVADNFYSQIGVSLNIPIFGRFATRTSVRKAKLSLQIAEVTEQLAKNNLNKTIAQAVLDLRAADRKYASAQQTYQSDKDAFDVVQQRYNVGVVNSLDYNTSLTTLNAAQFNMIEAQYELVFRSKIIDYYLGNPITL